LAAAGLASIAGTKPWVTGRSGSAGALALVVLACWGVLLVTRGRVRRVVAVLAVIAAAGLVVASVEAFWSLPTKLTDALSAASGVDTASTGFTPWYAAALVGAVLSVTATTAAVVLVRHWPEMGTRYDAPAGTGGAGSAVSVPTENIDIWKALDEGRDPTA